MVTNNQAEYEAILKGLQLLHEVKAEAIVVFGDSQLIINQLIGLYECKEDTLRDIMMSAKVCSRNFLMFLFNIFREHRIKRLIV